jgi:hypothetical protein
MRFPRTPTISVSRRTMATINECQKMSASSVEQCHSGLVPRIETAPHYKREQNTTSQVGILLLNSLRTGVKAQP